LFILRESAPSSCYYANLNNYSSCIDTELKDDNIVSPSRIIFVELASPSSSITTGDKKLYVADTLNHCIRVINLVTLVVSTVAGVCTKAGFVDGPLGTNRLSLPSMIAVDESENVYFYDSGSSYMRYLN